MPYQSQSQPAEDWETRRPASRLNTSDQVAHAISVGILKRQYLIGQRLTEAELTREHGVSRSTVREALKTLAATGVVELIPHRGAIIRSFTRTDAEDLLQLLEVLCGLAARLAAQRIGIGENRARFETVTRQLLDHEGDEGLRRMLDRRARFYQTLFEIADNAELNRAVPAARAHLYRAQMYASATHTDLKAMAAEYRAIADAILDGDTGKAEARARRHIENTMRRTLPRL
ncbi:MAG: GntR family transcriptional regulator [Burkholderiaceae bacterium]